MKLNFGEIRKDRRKCFTKHIVKLWNPVQHDVRVAANLNNCKRGLGIFMEE